jgi:plasmid maintenance system antidote protein VapI
MRKTIIAPIHPGEILMEEFMKPLGISQYRVAKDINVPARRRKTSSMTGSQLKSKYFVYRAGARS